MKKLIFKFTTFILVFILILSCCGCGGNKSGLLKDANLVDRQYKLGDYMCDYIVTDVNGNKHTFSEILKEKDAIVLNFWFINCGPCQMEFPYLQSAYNKYSDNIEVFAINAIDGKKDDIIKYANQNGISLPMVVGENSWITAFSLQGFPTTVVIDRYGTIAFMHMGSITQEGVFEKIFDTFTNKNYEQQTYKNISDFN